MKTVILYPPGMLTPESVNALNEAGYLPVPCEKPEAISILLPSLNQLRADRIVQALVASLSGTNSAAERQLFGRLMLELIAGNGQS